jgi:hypothetical protein
MKTAKWMLAMMVTLLPGLAAAQLTSSQTVVAKVPFEFVTANKVVPAGQVTVQTLNMGSKTLVIRNVGARAAALSNSMTVETRQPAANCALIFHKYGNQYFLTEVKVEGDRTSYRMPESKAEAELQAQNLPVAETTLLASLR